MSEQPFAERLGAAPKPDWVSAEQPFRDELRTKMSRLNTIQRQVLINSVVIMIVSICGLITAILSSQADRMQRETNRSNQKIIELHQEQIDLLFERVELTR